MPIIGRQFDCDRKPLEPVWDDMYRYPTSGLELFLWCFYLLADTAVVALILRSRSRWEGVVVAACNHRAFCSQTSAISARIICE